MKHLLRLLSLLALSCGAYAGNYVGDYAPGDTVDCNFGTVRPSTGASFTLAGSPVISAYKDNSTTQGTTGVTLTADFDSVTGFNHVRVTTGSDGTFFSAGSFFDLVITTGTVDSVSVTGQPVCSFTLNKVSALRPTTAARTVDVAATGEVGLDITNVITCTGAIPALGIIDCGTAQSVTGTTLVLRSAANFDANDEILNATCVIGTATTGAGQSRLVRAYANATDTATVDIWTTTPTGTITYVCYGTSSSTFANDSITAAAIASDAGTELGTATWASATRTLTTASDTSGTTTLLSRLSSTRAGYLDNLSVGAVATASALTTVSGKIDVIDDYVDTEVASILAAVDTEIATIVSSVSSIKLKTDQMNFGVTNQLDVNVESQNTAALCGAGTSGDKWRGCP